MDRKTLKPVHWIPVVVTTIVVIGAVLQRSELGWITAQLFMVLTAFVWAINGEGIFRMVGRGIALSIIGYAIGSVMSNASGIPWLLDLGVVLGPIYWIYLTIRNAFPKKT